MNGQHNKKEGILFRHLPLFMSPDKICATLPVIPEYHQNQP